MFQRKLATALGTCDKNRTSNGAADVLYVLLKSLTALGLQACFFLQKNIGVMNEFAVDKLTRMVQIVKIAADVRQRACGTTTIVDGKKIDFSR